MQGSAYPALKTPQPLSACRHWPACSPSPFPQSITALAAASRAHLLSAAGCFRGGLVVSCGPRRWMWGVEQPWMSGGDWDD